MNEQDKMERGEGLDFSEWYFERMDDKCPELGFKHMLSLDINSVPGHALDDAEKTTLIDDVISAVNTYASNQKEIEELRESLGDMLIASTTPFSEGDKLFQMKARSKAEALLAKETT